MMQKLNIILFIMYCYLYTADYSVSTIYLHTCVDSD